MAHRIKPQPHHGSYDLVLTYLSNLNFHHHAGLPAHHTELFIVLGELCSYSSSQNPLSLPRSLRTNSNLHWALPSRQSLHHFLKALCTLYSHSLSTHLTSSLYSFPVHHLAWSLAKCKAQYMFLPGLASPQRLTKDWHLWVIEYIWATMRGKFSEIPLLFRLTPDA